MKTAPDLTFWPGIFHSGRRAGSALPSPSSHGARRSAQAFTLIEVMVAMALFALIVLAIYTSWSAILRGSRAGLAAAADAQRTRMAMRAVREALSSTQLYLYNNKYYSFFADTKGDFADISFVAQLPDSFPGSGMYANQPIRRVRFFVGPGGDGKNRLMLTQQPFLEPMDRNNKPYEISLAPNVRQFYLEFLDTKYRWVEEWPYTNQLPRMVRVTLNFGEGQGRVRPEDSSVETVYLSSMPIPAQLQMPGRSGR